MYDEIIDKFHKIEKKLGDPEISKNLDELKKLGKERSDMVALVDLVLSYQKLDKQYQDNLELIEGSDPEMKAMAEEENNELSEKIEKLKEVMEEKRCPKDPRDAKNIIVEIRGGAGGDESALFAGNLFRMYTRYAEKRNFKVDILNSNTSGIGGLKEVIFEIKGPGAYGIFKHEAGTHRVQRVPETEKQGRVHTSTATVVIMPEAEEVDLEIKANDIRIDTFCSSGPGGQSVNTTYSAIRIVHLSTGTTVSCQDQKSQHQNKEKAMQILRARLLAIAEAERQEKETKERQGQVGGGDRSDKIRTYNFPQDRITDHRLNMSWHNINTILEGDLDPIISEFKKLRS